MEAREATATGESCMRVDAIAKVTGRARYTDDYVMAGMCYAKYVRSPIAHGYAVSINDEQARSLPGVLAILGMPGHLTKTSAIPPIAHC